MTTQSSNEPVPIRQNGLMGKQDCILFPRTQCSRDGHDVHVLYYNRRAHRAGLTKVYAKGTFDPGL